MRNKLLAISLAVGIVLLYLTLKHTNFSELWTVISSLNPLWLLAYLFISICIDLTLAIRWRLISKEYGYNISLFKILLYRLAGHGISYLTPSAKLGGEPVRAALLARHGSDKEFQKSLTTVGIDKTFELAFSGVFFFIGSLIVGLATPHISLGARITLLCLGLFFLTLTSLFYLRTFNGKPFFSLIFKISKLSKIKLVVEQFESVIADFYKHHRKVFWKTFWINSLSWVLMFLEYKTALLALGFNANFGLIFLVFSMVGLAYLFPIPLAIGSLEAGQLSLSKISNLPTTSGLALAFLTRARDLLVAIIGLAVIAFEGVGVVKALKTQPKYYVTIPNIGVVKLWDRELSRNLAVIYKKRLLKLKQKRSKNFHQ